MNGCQLENQEKGMVHRPAEVSYARDCLQYSVQMNRIMPSENDHNYKHVSDIDIIYAMNGIATKA